MRTFRVRGEDHTYVGLISVTSGVANLVFYVLAAWVWVLGTEIEFKTKIMTSLILGGIGLVSGLAARLGSKKDDWGTVGVILAILVEIFHLLW